jgi:hypothetical protein
MKCTITLIRDDNTIAGLCIQDACYLLKQNNGWTVARIVNGPTPTPWK